MSLIERFRRGDVRALARALSLLEDHDPAADDLLAGLPVDADNARIVGITGPPGAGKSSLITGLVTHWRRAQQRVAVLAFDPSSPRTGGAALGDRLRFGSLATDPGVFIRSLAARGWPGGLSAAAGAATRLVVAFGFDIVVLETVGVGQADIDVSRLADVVVVVQAPGLGDDMQAIKAGLLEVADIIVVTKGDLTGADRLASQLRSLAVPAGRPPPPVLVTSATHGDGIAALADTILAVAPTAAQPVPLSPTAARELVVELAVSELRRRLLAADGLAALADDVLAGRRSAADAARELIRRQFALPPAETTSTTPKPNP